MNDLVQQQETAAQDLPIVATDTSALVLDQASMDRMYRLAEIMAKGKSTIPDHLKNNVGDCMAIVMQAVQWRMNPYAVAQKTHTVNGALGYEAQLVNAVINTMAPTKDRIHYEWYGDWSKVIGKWKIISMPANPDKGKKQPYEFRVPGWSLADEIGLGVRVWATMKGEDEPRVLELGLEQASVRNSPLWASDPKQQLAYLAVKRWSRLYCPDVILGVYTPDEFDGQSEMRDLNQPLPKNAKPADYAARKQQAEPIGPSEELLKSARNAADNGKNAFSAFWKTITPADRGSLRGEMNDLENRCKDSDTRTVESAKTAAPVEDDFVKDMDAHTGEDGEYVRE